MTDTAAPARTPLDAANALAQHVPLTAREWLLTWLLVGQLRESLPVVPVDVGPNEVHPAIQLVASDAFGRHLAARVRQGDTESATVAFLQLMMDVERLGKVIDEAGLQNRFLTYKND